MHFTCLLPILALAGTFATSEAPRTEARRPWFLVRVYRGTDAPPVGAASLGPLAASDCQTGDVYSGAPPQEAVALKLLRIVASHSGADAVVKVSCSTERIEGCISALTCSGEAVRLPKAAPRPK